MSVRTNEICDAFLDVSALVPLQVLPYCLGSTFTPFHLVIYLL